MKYYLAPMEGITGHIYRNALEKYFPGTDRYFAPFIVPDQNRVLRTKEQRDVLPGNNHVPELIPQILTCNAEHFHMTVQALQEMGYQEVNLNFGCPSGTVVSKKRGSGILAYPEELDRFLDQIFEENPEIRISVKTRIGRDDDENAFELMEIYRRYPLSELIIHPRTQKDFYRGTPRMERFGQLLETFENEKHAKNGEDGVDHVDNQRAGQACGGYPICYNGNLLTERDYRNFVAEYPQVDAVMAGRGVIADPGLFRRIRTGRATDRETLQLFLEEVLEGYRSIFDDDRNALFRMKEMWVYLIHLFADAEKYRKKIRKAQSLLEYRAAVNALLGECEMVSDGPECWVLPQK